jgi:hypothetical protein
VDLVDEEHVVFIEIGEQSRQIARLFDGGPEVTRMFTPISLAMTPASVVLPRPGGP